MKLKKKKQFLFFGRESFKVVDDTIKTKSDIEIGIKDNIILDFSGGGIRGVLSAYKGAELENKYPELSCRVTSVWGASTGAIIGALYNFGMIKDDWDFKKILKFYIEKGKYMLEPKWFGGGLFGGAYSNKKLMKMLQDIFKDITLEELYNETQVMLNIRITNITDRKTEVFNCDTNPDCKVWEAVFMSTSAPVFFQTYRYKNKIYGDGGISGTYNTNMLYAYWSLVNSGKNIDIKKIKILSFGTGLTKLDKMGKSKLSQIKWVLGYSSHEAENYQIAKLKKYEKEYGVKFCRWNIVLKGDTNMANTDLVDNLLKQIDNKLIIE